MFACLTKLEEYVKCNCTVFCVIDDIVLDAKTCQIDVVLEYNYTAQKNGRVAWISDIYSNYYDIKWKVYSSISHCSQFLQIESKLVNMVSVSHGSLTRWSSESWYTDICHFRSNSSLYLSKHRLTPEGLAADILQVFSDYSLCTKLWHACNRCLTWSSIS